VRHWVQSPVLKEKKKKNLAKARHGGACCNLNCQEAEDLKVKACLGYIIRPCLQQNTKNKTTATKENWKKASWALVILVTQEAEIRRTVA
jgi:hypothetical protein